MPSLTRITKFKKNAAFRRVGGSIPKCSISKQVWLYSTCHKLRTSFNTNSKLMSTYIRTYGHGNSSTCTTSHQFGVDDNCMPQSMVGSENLVQKKNCLNSGTPLCTQAQEWPTFSVLIKGACIYTGNTMLL